MLYHTPQGSSTPGKPVVPQIPVKMGNGTPAQSQFLRAASPSLVYWCSKISSTESRSPRRNLELNFHTVLVCGTNQMHGTYFVLRISEDSWALMCLTTKIVILNLLLNKLSTHTRLNQYPKNHSNSPS